MVNSKNDTIEKIIRIIEIITEIINRSTLVPAFPI
jgi:hypothetical protein